MKVNDNYFLGKDAAGFFLWNNKKIVRLISKDIKEVFVELKLKTKTK
ncbi:hypothetical protein [Chryseobacterium lathyri]|nr:hypothetical protein [Chryseobacterium lathyri]